MHANGLLTILQENYLKSIVLQSMWKGPFTFKNYGTYLSPRLHTLKDLSTWIGE